MVNLANYVQFLVYQNLAIMGGRGATKLMGWYIHPGIGTLTQFVKKKYS